MTKRKNIMLAYPFEEKRLAKWKPPYIVQPKLDGVRCRAEVKNGRVDLLSSSDTLISSVPHINTKLESFISLLSIRDIELDGELYYHGYDFDSINSIVSRQYASTLHDDHNMIEYHIFDIVNRDSQFKSILQLEGLANLLKGMPSKSALNAWIKVVPYNLVKDYEGVMSLLNSYYNEQKYEGVMIRNMDAPYVRKRATTMMKFKPKKVDYYRLVRVEEAISESGEPKEMIGSIICSDGTSEFSVSGGNLTHTERRHFWFMKGMLEDQKFYVKVGYQNITEKNKVPRSGICMEITPNNPEEEMEEF